MKYLLISSLILFSCHLVHADEFDLDGRKTNGCGTDGIAGLLVPDSTIFSRCQFKKACDTHDLCYGRCQMYRDLHGKTTCKDPIAKEGRRKVCDTTFFDDIVSDNKDRGICKFYAKIYQTVVKTFGKGNFFGYEIEQFAKLEFKKGTLNPDNFNNALKEFKLKQFNQGDSTPMILDFDKDRSVLMLKKDNKLFELQGHEFKQKNIIMQRN